MSSSENLPPREGARARVLALVLVLACLGTGLWAVPQFLQAREFAASAESSYSPPAAEVPAPVETSGTLDTSAIDSSLSALAEGFSGGSLTGTVVDPATGAVLYSHGADRARVPASNLKLLTDYALVRVMDPSARFSTSVAVSGDTLTLVAGGDTLLGTGESTTGEIVGRAGLRTLATETYAALEGGTAGTYTLNLDTSIYAGEATNPAWSQEDIDAQEVGAVFPLAFYSHYSPGNDGAPTGSRPLNAAQQVQRHLLDELNDLGADSGMSFTLGEETATPEGAEQLAAVESATVAEQAAYMMQQSDNMLAEALGRNASVAAGGDGSFLSARRLVEETLAADGIPTEHLSLVDLCGLSGENRVTGTTLAAVVSAMVQGEKGADVALAGLPVAGGSGTLADRFDDPDEQAAQGYARAKTGTLNSVVALSGYLVTESGHTLVFSFIVNDVTDSRAARDVVDTSVAALRAG